MKVFASANHVATSSSPVAMIFATLVSILFTAFGVWYRYKLLLGNNMCSMTFSYRNKEAVNVTSAVSDGAKLWRYGSGIKLTGKKTRRDLLKPRPVLFLHGHLGK